MFQLFGELPFPEFVPQLYVPYRYTYGIYIYTIHLKMTGEGVFLLIYKYINIVSHSIKYVCRIVGVAHLYMRLETISHYQFTAFFVE